ncbi:eukaryotic translation initiation factor 2C, 2 [Chytriomyces hyalinus]|nr:eukaryotic translation initiation factor 2C, 2 [Chytriomyces hyalinus]
MSETKGRGGGFAGRKGGRAPAEEQPEPEFKPNYEIVSRELIRPKRPSTGVRGKAIKLFANSYELTIPEANCFHYDVEIRPETLPPINRRIFEEWKKTHVSTESKLAVYDGRKNMYTPRVIPIEDNTEGDVTEIVLTEANQAKEQRFRFRIRKVADINMERLHQFISGTSVGEVPRDALAVLDLLLASRPNELFTAVNKKLGSSFFRPAEPQFNISSGLNLRQGWKQSVKTTLKSVLLNLDVASTAFYRAGPLLDVVASYFNKSRIQDVNPRSVAPGTVEFQRLGKFLSNVNVEITYRDTGRRRYKIRGLSKLTPDQAVITRDDGSKINVSEYFKKEFNLTLKYPFLPLTACGNEGQILIPMECLLVRDGQRHVGKLSDIQTADVIKITAVPPPERQKRIADGRKVLHDVGETALLKEWNVQLKPDMKIVNARVLPAPTLTGSTTISPQNGAYDLMRAANVKFFRPARLEFWGVAVFGDTRRMPFDATSGFINMLINDCSQRGMVIAKRELGKIMIAQQRRSVEETLVLASNNAIKAARESGTLAPDTAIPGRAQMIFCFMDKGSTAYDEIKLLGETKLNIMTQCIQSRHLPPNGPKPGVCVNLALKINGKLGGVNMTVDPAKMLNVLGKPIPTMIMGADVSHPPAGSQGGVSIASVVASMDSKFAEYRASIKVQGPRLEIIGDLKGMCAELMEQFKGRAKGRMPSRVLFFRDGVGEGQFNQVAIQEVQNLKAALQALGAPDTKLTFLVVNKRHSHRFFAQDSREADRKGNVMAGTVVDSGITHPFEFDFFLNSHQGLQGTSRSAHYHVLYDENNFSPDDLQEICYRMCYLFSRATRSVGLVPAVYYAHLVAQRARCYRPGGVGGSSEMAGSSGSGAGGIESAAIDEFLPVTEEMKKTMYFI